jgi:chromosomal replication initiation ATPase DnaA
MNDVRDVILGLTKVDIFENNRKQLTVEMRSLANYFLKKMRRWTLSDIARWYIENGKSSHHSTILFSVENFEMYSKYNKRLGWLLEELNRSVSEAVSMIDIIEASKDLLEEDRALLMQFIYTRKASVLEVESTMY